MHPLCNYATLQIVSLSLKGCLPDEGNLSVTGHVLNTQISSKVGLNISEQSTDKTFDKRLGARNYRALIISQRRHVPQKQILVIPKASAKWSTARGLPGERPTNKTNPKADLGGPCCNISGP